MPFDDVKFFVDFRQTVSDERLTGYCGRGETITSPRTFTHYVWNVALSESLYPALHFLEVALRNAIHGAAIKAFERDDWYNIHGLLNQRSLNDLDKVKNKLVYDRKPLTPPNIVAGLTFGFWTGLLHASYDQVFFTRISRNAFPNMARSERVSRTFSGPFNKIRKLRNRIMHHEPIWHHRDLRSQHQKIYMILKCINPSKLVVLQAIDRFPTLYDTGSDVFETDFHRSLQREYASHHDNQ